MRIVAIDPGTTQSALLVYEDGKVIESVFLSNYAILDRIKANNFGRANWIACEMIASYGMPVGKETFETVLWIGRFMERAKIPFKLVYRKDIKVHLCGTAQAKDSNIRQRLIDLLGPQGTKKNPGPTYGISKHAWAALAVAVYADETIK